MEEVVNVQCELLKRRLWDAEKVLQSKNVLIEMLRGQLRQMEENHRSILDIKEQMRLKCLRLEEDYSKYKKICNKLENENLRLHASLSNLEKNVGVEKLAKTYNSGVEKIFTQQNNILKGFLTSVMSETSSKVCSCETIIINDNGDSQRPEKLFNKNMDCPNSVCSCAADSEIYYGDDYDVCNVCGLSKSKMEKMEEIIREYTGIIGRLECEVQLLALSIKKVNEVDAHKCSCEKEIKQLVHTVNDIVTDRDSYKREVMSMSENFRTSIVTEKDSVIDKLTNDLDAGKAQLKELEKKIDALKRENMQLKKENYMMKDDESNTDHQNIAVVNLDYEKQIMDQTITIEKLQKDIRHLLSENERYKAAIHDQEHIINELTNDRNDLRNKLRLCEQMTDTNLGIDEEFLRKIQLENVQLKEMMEKFLGCIDRYMEELGEDKCDCDVDGGLCAVEDPEMAAVKIDQKQKRTIMELRGEVEQYQDMIEDLKGLLSEKSVQQEKCMAEVIQKTHHIQMLESTIEGQKQEIVELLKKLNETNAALSNCKYDLQEAQAELTECRAERLKAIEDLNTCREQLNKCKEELKNCKGTTFEINLTNRELDNWRNDARMYKQKYEDIVPKLADAKQKLKELLGSKPELLKLRKENEALKQAIEELTAKLMDCKSKFMDLKANYENVLSASKTLKEQQMEINKLIRWKDCKFYAALDEIDRLNSDVTKLEEKILNLRKEHECIKDCLNEQLRRQVTENNLIKTRLESQVQKYKHICQIQEKSMSSFQCGLSNLKTNLSKLNGENKNIKDQVNEMSQEQQLLIEHKCICEKEINDLLNSYEQFHLEMGKLNNMVYQYKEVFQTQSFVRGTPSCKASMEPLERGDNTEISSLKRENEEIKEKLHFMETELLDIQQQADTYRVISQQLEAEKNKLLNVIESMEQEVCCKTNDFIKQQTGDYDELSGKYCSLKDLFEVQEKIYQQKIEEVEQQYQAKQSDIKICPAVEQMLKKQLEKCASKKILSRNDLKTITQYISGIVCELSSVRSNFKKMIGFVSEKVKMIYKNAGTMEISELAQSILRELEGFRAFCEEQVKCEKKTSCNCMNVIASICSPNKISANGLSKISENSTEDNGGNETEEHPEYKTVIKQNLECVCAPESKPLIKENVESVGAVESYFVHQVALDGTCSADCRGISTGVNSGELRDSQKQDVKIKKSSRSQIPTKGGYNREKTSKSSVQGIQTGNTTKGKLSAGNNTTRRNSHKKGALNMKIQTQSIPEVNESEK